MEDDEEATPWKEQETWEADQIKKASMAVGTKDRKKGQKQYDLVLPDQIEFITDMVMAGDVVRASHPHGCACDFTTHRKKICLAYMMGS